MPKIIFYLVIGLLLLSAGCVAIDEAGMEGPGPDAPFGPASLAGMWKGESNWDGTAREIRVLVRRPIIERMVSPTGQAPAKTVKVSGESKEGKASESVKPVWEQVNDPGLVFWGWDIFFKGEEKINFVNLQFIFKEDGPGKLAVVSQSGGTGNAIFVQENGEKRIELALAHPLLKEIKGRILYEGNKINGSFTFLGKEGIFKLAKDNSKPAENQPPPQPKE
ncbi:MAG: hypothetical protein HZA49_05785 [Planctomycetes bacterium]|nr:hypothetical protein [Planctomycetota bacterium]